MCMFITTISSRECHFYGFRYRFTKKNEPTFTPPTGREPGSIDSFHLRDPGGVLIHLIFDLKAAAAPPPPPSAARDVT